MLDGFARHAGVDLQVETQGDLHIDMHHTVEDTGIALGPRSSRRWTASRACARFGFAYIPMDET